MIDVLPSPPSNSKKKELFVVEEWIVHHHHRKSLNCSENDTPLLKHSVLPLNVEACVISEFPTDTIMRKRNAFSANWLKKTKLLVKNQVASHPETLKQNKLETQNNVGYKNSRNLKENDVGQNSSKKNSKEKSSLLVKKKIMNTVDKMKLPAVRNSNESLKKHTEEKCEPQTKTKEQNAIVTRSGSLPSLDNEYGHEHVNMSSKVDTEILNRANKQGKVIITKYKITSPVKKSTKIYYSERQSRNLNGIPCVPPSTPSENFLQNSVPSLSDIKSQRSIKDRLLKLSIKQEKIEKAKLKKVLQKEKEKSLDCKEQLIRFQRKMIYELNAIMTEHENRQFEEFKLKQRGAPV